MKVVILAGGFGTRLSEYTDTIPKPMVPIGGKPIIEHIMSIYAGYGHKEFYIALGYKGEVIKDYFKNFRKDWKINLIDTGSNTLTGGRLKRLESLLSKETFLPDTSCNVKLSAAIPEVVVFGIAFTTPHTRKNTAKYDKIRITTLI